jgi:hypothetical protein
LDGDAGRATGASEDGDEPVARIDGGLDYGRVFLGFEGEELTRAAGREESCGTVWGEPLEALGIASGVKIAVRRKVGDWERQKAGGQYFLKLWGGHGDGRQEKGEE